MNLVTYEAFCLPVNTKIGASWSNVNSDF